MRQELLQGDYNLVFRIQNEQTTNQKTKKKSTVDMNPERALLKTGVAVKVDKTAPVLLKQQRERPG